MCKANFLIFRRVVMFLKEVTILMLMLSVLPAYPLKMGYKKVGTACLMYNDVFYTEHARSKIECSSICENNKFGLCSRFMYDSSRNMCLLHSDTTIQGRNSVAIQTNETWDFYGIAHEDCNLPGYDFVPSIHACFKHYYKVDSSWVSARDICINDGGDLVIIDIQETYDFLFNYVNCVGKLWFGLRDYKWVNGQPFTNNLGLNILWNDEVDSENPSDPYYDCGLLGFKSGYKIVDVSCTVKIRKFFVCEIPMIPVS